jgi:hypothetical protein
VVGKVTRLVSNTQGISFFYAYRSFELTASAALAVWPMGTLNIRGFTHHVTLEAQNGVGQDAEKSCETQFLIICTNRLDDRIFDLQFSLLVVDIPFDYAFVQSS